jgi:hypothetical protein
VGTLTAREARPPEEKKQKNMKNMYLSTCDASEEARVDDLRQRMYTSLQSKVHSIGIFKCFPEIVFFFIEAALA